MIWLTARLCQTEAGCRVLISLILLRVASTMSTDQMDVNIIPEYPISRTLFPGNRSFGGAVDFLLTKLPGRYTRRKIGRSSLHSFDLDCTGYLLGDPTTALGNPDAIKGPVTSYIFEAKRDNVRATIPRAVIAAASYCKQHRCGGTSPFNGVLIPFLLSIQVLRGCITSREQWIVFVYNMAKGGGGFVSCSDEYNIGAQFEGLPLILGLLHDWVCESQCGFLRYLTVFHRSTTPLISSKCFSPMSNRELCVHWELTS